MDETLPPKKPVWSSITPAELKPGLDRDSDQIPEWIGPYRVVKKIGAGSMGNVYRCHDATLGREVAIKVMKTQYAGDEHYRRRFRREARAVARLSHPCVVQIYSIHEEISASNESAYIVMEFVDGSSADDILVEDGPLPLELATTWIRDAATGLREAAAKDIIHRDVKPSNILVTPAGGAKIVDFGLAKELGAKNSLTQDGIVLGTPHYISPEQGRGRALDHRADIYSLGATFYHLITGRPPFDGDSQISVIVAHVNESPVAPHKERPCLPESATRVIFRMLEKAPDERYGDYDELIEDLDALVAGKEPSHARASTDRLVPEVPVHARRRAKLALALVAVLFMGGIAVALAWPKEGPLPHVLKEQLDTWCKVQDGYAVELDLDFSGPLPNVGSPLVLLKNVLALPRSFPSEAVRPDFRENALAWSQFDVPFAFAFSFERLDEAEIWVGESQGDFDLAFSLVHPHGAQNRQFIFRISPRNAKDSRLLTAFERNEEVAPIKRDMVRQAHATGGLQRAYPFRNKALLLGAGPFRLKFQFKLDPIAGSTRIEVSIVKPARGGGRPRSYLLSAEFPGKDWARGVPTLVTNSSGPFAVSLRRAVFKGRLAQQFTVTEVPWQR